MRDVNDRMRYELKVYGALAEIERQRRYTALLHLVVAQIDAPTHRSPNDPQQALAYFEKSEALLKKLDETPDKLLGCLLAMGDLFIEVDPARSLEFYLQARGHITTAADCHTLAEKFVVLGRSSSIDPMELVKHVGELIMRSDTGDCAFQARMMQEKGSVMLRLALSSNLSLSS